MVQVCGNKLFRASLGNVIEWTLVKLMDNVQKWSTRTIGKTRKWGCILSSFVCGESFFGWNDTSVELYKVLRGCF